MGIFGSSEMGGKMGGLAAYVQLARVQSAATVSVSPTLASPSPAGPGPGDSDSDSDNVMAVLSIRDHHMNLGVPASARLADGLGSGS